jgi:hypothetical protein
VIAAQARAAKAAGRSGAVDRLDPHRLSHPVGGAAQGEQRHQQATRTLGLAPFDDGLPGDPPNVFSLNRATILFAELPATRGGHVGANADLQSATPQSMEHYNE